MKKSTIISCSAVAALSLTGFLFTNYDAFAADNILSQGQIEVFTRGSNDEDEPTKNLSITLTRDSAGKIVVENQECFEKSEACDKVKYDEKTNTLQVENLTNDSKTNNSRILMISLLGDLTINIKGKNSFITSAMGTNLTFDGDGSLEGSTISVDNGTLLFKSGNYYLGGDGVVAPVFAFSDSNTKGSLINISSDLEIKEKGIKIYRNDSTDTDFITEYFVNDSYSYDPNAEDFSTGVEKIHIGPKTKTADNTTEKTEEKGEKSPNTGTIMKELSLTVASILGTVAVALAIVMTVVLVKKKTEKKPLDY